MAPSPTHARGPSQERFDELLDASALPRPHAATLMASLERLGPDELAAAGRRRDLAFLRRGVTFEVIGESGERPNERPFPLDLVPRIIAADEWQAIERGLVQRIRALNAFVDDVYHERQIVRHVKIGHGRHYADVPPIKGVYRGPADSELEARVEMHRLNGDGAA